MIVTRNKNEQTQSDKWFNWRYNHYEINSLVYMNHERRKVGSIFRKILKALSPKLVLPFRKYHPTFGTGVPDFGAVM